MGGLRFVGWLFVCAYIGVGIGHELFPVPSTLHGETGWLGVLIIGCTFLLYRPAKDARP